MKKAIASIIMCLFIFGTLAACEKDEITPDYINATAYEQALNDGIDTTGKIVQFVVDSINPDSAFGYNLMAGEHLNFCSNINPKISVGDGLTIKVKEVNYFMGSYIIYYEVMK